MGDIIGQVLVTARGSSTHGSAGRGTVPARLIAAPAGATQPAAEPTVKHLSSPGPWPASRRCPRWWRWGRSVVVARRGRPLRRSWNRSGSPTHSLSGSIYHRRVTGVQRYELAERAGVPQSFVERLVELKIL